jgi:integrase
VASRDVRSRGQAGEEEFTTEFPIRFWARAVAAQCAQLVDRPSIEHREMSTWTPKQAERFREHVRDHPYTCRLLTLAGCRRSEVLGLAWSAVDLNAGTVTVAHGRALVRGGARRPVHRSQSALRARCRCPPRSWRPCGRCALSKRRSGWHSARATRIRDSWPSPWTEPRSGPRRIPTRSPVIARLLGCRRSGCTTPDNTAATRMLDSGTDCVGGGQVAR